VLTIGLADAGVFILNRPSQTADARIRMRFSERGSCGKAEKLARRDSGQPGTSERVMAWQTWEAQHRQSAVRKLRETCS
jgi:hypothetical protein